MIKLVITSILGLLKTCIYVKSFIQNKIVKVNFIEYMHVKLPIIIYVNKVK